MKSSFELDLFKFVLIVLLPIYDFVKSTPFSKRYCQISPEHTMCKYKRTSSKCIQYKMTDRQGVEQILSDHNRARSVYAGGSKGFLIPNMMKMYWDQELADISSMWACQCRRSLDKNRDVERFNVGQIVRTEVMPESYTPWKTIWNKILQSSDGFYARDIAGKMTSDFHPDQPLSYIYNPSVRFVGCTLANYFSWCLNHNHTAFTTVLICNYGPITDDYHRKLVFEENWPCRSCPFNNPCFTDHYWDRHMMPERFQDERNLCIDPKLESSKPRPGKTCPTSVHHVHEQLGNNWFENDDYDDLGLIPLQRKIQNLTERAKNTVSTSREEYSSMSNSKHSVDYCSFVCDNSMKHTMCVYEEKSNRCERFFNLMNTAVKDDLLNLHNNFRNDFASAKLGRTHPLASNMMLMSWKNELQEIAHRWVSQCHLSHDYCRDLAFKDQKSRGKLQIFKVGQNIGWRSYNNKLETAPSHRDIFEDWVKQLANFSVTSITGYVQYTSPKHLFVEDFVQLIWAQTYHVGCGYGSFKQTNTTSSVFLVCNYSPGGNREGLPIYIPGGPCTTCSTQTDFRRSTCGMRYANLCTHGGNVSLQASLFILVMAAFCATFCATVLEPSTLA